ncbi:MAG: 3D domain-containing protein, partial [Bacteroidales bacterium]
MKPPIRAMLAAVFIALFIAVVGSASLADSTRVAPSKPAARAAQPQPPPATPPVAVPTARYTATAYCQQGVTRSGVDTHAGIAAADPDVLPVGSVVHVLSSSKKYTGVYTVLDTGSKVQGRHVDLFIRDCREAQQFGR